MFSTPLSRRCLWCVALAALFGLAPPGLADVILGGPVQQIEVRQARGNGIFVPQPRGAGETLDDTAADGKPAEGDVVTTVRGDRIVGDVLTIESGGELHLTAPHFKGEIVLLAAALRRVDLRPKDTPRGDDEVLLSNGDHILGELAAITPDAVVIESDATGPVKISRKIIRQINFSRTNKVSLESHFDQGRLEPWKMKGSGWSIANGALQCLSYGSSQTVFAPFQQGEAVTMEAKVQAIGGRYINCEMVLFSDTKDAPYGRNSVVARYYSSQFYLMRTQNGGTNSIANRHIGSVLRQATVRFAYDPETGKAHAWLNSNSLGEYAVPNKLATGKFVLFNSRYPCRITTLRVLRGVVPPSASEKKEETDTHVVRFANKDRVAAGDMALADGMLALETTFGKISAQVGKVQAIHFRSKGVEKPRRRKGDVHVETAASRLTIEFKQLTPEFLIGTSSYLGEVKVRRACLKRIQFNIYK